jgi:hypothetical protein
VRVVGEGLLIGGKLEVELTGAVSKLSADLLGALLSFPCLSAGRRVRFLDHGVVTFSALKGEIAGCSNRMWRPTARGLRQDRSARQSDEPLSRLLVPAQHGMLSRRARGSSIGRVRRRPARSQAQSQ